jgi:hypothetical protein
MPAVNDLVLSPVLIRNTSPPGACNTSVRFYTVYTRRDGWVP